VEAKIKTIKDMKSKKAWKPAATVKTGLRALLCFVLSTGCSHSQVGNSDYALAAVRLNGKYGFIDKEGKEVTANAALWAKTTRQIFAGVAIGCTAGIYAWNVLDAALAKGKIRYAWIPDNVNLTSSESEGNYYAGVTIKF
jgi:hypothetical protein